MTLIGGVVGGKGGRGRQLANKVYCRPAAVEILLAQQWLDRCKHAL